MSISTGASGRLEVDERSIAEPAAGMESGAFSSHTLVEAYLQPIQTIDQSGPTLNAAADLTSTG